MWLNPNCTSYKVNSSRVIFTSVPPEVRLSKASDWVVTNISKMLPIYNWLPLAQTLLSNVPISITLERMVWANESPLYMLSRHAFQVIVTRLSFLKPPNRKSRLSKIRGYLIMIRDFWYLHNFGRLKKWWSSTEQYFGDSKPLYPTNFGEWRKNCRIQKSSVKL